MYIFNYIHVFSHLHMYTHTRTYVYAQTQTCWGGKESSNHWKRKKIVSYTMKSFLKNNWQYVHRGLCWFVLSSFYCVLVWSALEVEYGEQKRALRYHVASAVIGLIKSAPDTGLRVTPMIPPRNSLAVGGVATCTVMPPPVAAVYATLRRQSTRFHCRSSVSSPSTLHVPWARMSPYTEPRFQEPTRPCFLLAFYAKLSQSSTRVWPVILTSVRPPSRNGARRCEVQKTTEQALLARIYLQQTLWKLFSQPRLRRLRVVL